jgi:hypothetical protein
LKYLSISLQASERCIPCLVPCRSWTWYTLWSCTGGMVYCGFSASTQHGTSGSRRSGRSCSSDTMPVRVNSQSAVVRRYSRLSKLWYRRRSCGARWRFALPRLCRSRRRDRFLLLLRRFWNKRCLVCQRRSISCQREELDGEEGKGGSFAFYTVHKLPCFESHSFIPPIAYPGIVYGAVFFVMTILPKLDLLKTTVGIEISNCQFETSSRLNLAPVLSRSMTCLGWWY